MKILVASGTPEQLGRGIASSLRMEGWNVVSFDTSPESPFYKPLIKPVRKIINALRIQRAPDTFESWAISNINWRSNRFLEAVKKNKPDIVLHVWGHRISEEIMREASCLSPIVCWMVEAKERFDGPMEYFDKGYYKHLIVYAQSYSELIKSDERPVHYMPHYAPLEKGISEKMPGDRKYDWVFLGAHSPWREICLSQLMQAYPNGLILGPRWNRLSRKFKSLSKIAHDGYLDGERSLECYREARVGVDIPSKQNWVDNGVTMRVPELISCGVHVLTRHIPEIKILPYYDDLSVTMYEDEDDIVHGMKKSLETVMTLTREQLESSSKKVSGYQELSNLLNQFISTDHQNQKNI
ncbi:hypothetical protein QQ056_09955 [Oscillatoria laete-virens NRMC-F 0139]|nr:hypothetical protein [Oscillatoria laete-virens]MDL5053868.1 hypothetical protein [Oscillatoria laete-virens NRMC-F 0139]